MFVEQVLKRFNDPNIEIFLRQAEKEPQFFPELLRALSGPNVENNIKLVAIIHFKNNIEKFWRKTADIQLSTEEKIEIKNNLLQLIGHPTRQIATQHALAIAKIARMDYPLDWPELFEQIVARIEQVFSKETNEIDQKVCSLIVLHQIIKALASKTLAASRKAFQLVAPKLMCYVWNVFQSNVTTFNQEMATPLCNPEKLKAYLDALKTCIQMFQRMILYGIKGFDGDVIQIENVIESIHVLFQDLMLKRSQLLHMQNRIPTSVDKLILRIGKFYCAIIQQKPCEFMALVTFPGVCEFFWTIVQKITPETSDEMLKRVAIKGLMIFKYLNKHPTVEFSDQGSDGSSRAFTVKQAVFTQNFVQELFNHLVLNYLLLTVDDLQLWQEDPEQFVSDEEADHWEYNIRSCAEKVVMELMSSYRHILVPIILDYMNRYSQFESTRQEAVLNAFGLCAHDLFEQVDFDQWLVQQHLPLTSNLIQSSCSQDRQAALVLLRRSSLLVGKWIGIKVSRETRPLIYQYLLELIQVDDLVVKLTACATLNFCLDDWDFEIGGFEPYFEHFLVKLVGLLGNVEDEFKMRIINCLSVMVERMHSSTSVLHRLHEMVIQVVPSLWITSQQHHLFQSSILVFMSKVVDTLQSQSSQISEIVVPILKQSVNPRENCHVYLYEDALDLWHSFVNFSTEKNDSLFELFPFTLELLENGTESLKKVLSIIESYLLLDAIQVLNKYSTQLLHKLTELLQNVTPKASKCILSLLDLIMLSCQPFLPSLVPIIDSSGLSRVLLENIQNENELGFIVAGYLSFFSRFLVVNPTLFIQHYNGQALDFLVGKWFSHFDKTSNFAEKRLNALGLSLLVRMQYPMVLEHMEMTLVILSSVLLDSSDDRLAMHASLASLSSLTSHSSFDEDKMDRRSLFIKATDIVHSTNFNKEIKENFLAAGQGFTGGFKEFESQILVKVDRDVLESFKQSF